MESLLGNPGVTALARLTSDRAPLMLEAGEWQSKVRPFKFFCHGFWFLI